MTQSRLGLLRDQNFRNLFIATLISQFGFRITVLALPLIAVLGLQASEFEVGVLFSLSTVAFLVIGLPAGAWVDRVRRRGVLVSGDLVRAALLGTVPLAWWADLLSIWQLYAVALLVGVATVFFDVAYQSYLPHLVGREHLVEGNARLESVRALTQVAGPGVAGQLIQWLTAPFAVAFSAVGLLFSALFVMRIRKPEPQPPRRPDAHLFREIGEGLSFVLRHRMLRPIATCTALFNLFWSAYSAVLILYLARTLDLSAGTIGLVLSIAGVGGVLGAFGARKVAAVLGQGPALWLTPAVSAPFALLMPAARPGVMLWIGAVGQAVVSAGTVIYNVTQVSIRQGVTPDGLLGRMNATMRFLVWGTLPLGGVVGGVLGQWVGIRQALWISAAGMVTAFLAVYLSPLRRMRRLPDSPEVTGARSG